jgi:UDP-glucose 4-epimerase
MRIFVTGGAGYVGSHCIRQLLDHAHDVVVIDNLSVGHRQAVDSRAEFVEGDLSDRALLARLFTPGRFDAAMHFAGSTEVGISVREPLLFYRNNDVHTLNLLDAMKAADVRKMVFSSTAATYGIPERIPIAEDDARLPINPYGRSKLCVEWMLEDSAGAWGLGARALRYFNACGASADGAIGEDHDPETHLIPIALQVALGQRDRISIFGTDYATPDGSCIRDYIHVEDLASVHRLAIESVEPGTFRAYNIGTGRGHSVREIVAAARRVTGHAIPAVESPRRPGDPPSLVASPDRLLRELGWKAGWTDIEQVIASAWKWHQVHPHGYGDS